jgi:hypothetical protein
VGLEPCPGDECVQRHKSSVERPKGLDLGALLAQRTWPPKQPAGPGPSQRTEPPPPCHTDPAVWQDDRWAVSRDVDMFL